MIKKRFLSIALTLVMLLGLLPSISLTASAADTTTTITSPATTGTMTITLTIAAASVKTAPEANTLTYSGSGQALTTTGEAEVGTMQYQLGESATTEPTGIWETTVPQGTEAKDYYVWYRSYVNDNNISAAGCVTARISPASIATTAVTLSATSLTWSGSEQSVTVSSVKLGNTTLNKETDYEVTGDTTGTSINTYTVTVTGKGNYTGKATATWSIVAKDINASAENVTVTYDGQPHGIDVKVTDPAGGATIKYGTTAENCTQDTSPTITDVTKSPFTVYYKVTATNYNDKTGTAIVTISKANQTAPEAPTKAGASINSITLNAIPNGEYKCGNGDWQTSPTFTGLNMNTEYTFYQRLKGDDNHNASESSTSASIRTSNHSHEWNYSGDGATITATCADSDGGHGDTKNATLTINAPALTTYGETDKDANATITGSIDGVTNPDIVYKKGSEMMTQAPTDAGTYTASITLGEATASVEYTIAPKEVTVSGITAGDKVYDGTIGATLNYNNAVFAGKLNSDDLTISATGTFDNANAGENKTVTITNLTLGGTSKDNYVLAANGQQTGTTAKITAKEVGLTWTDTDLTYNGQEQAPKATATGLVSGDAGKVNVNVTGGQTNVGTTAYTATASGLTGDKADNYKLPTDSTTSFTILPKSITKAVVTLDKTELTYTGSEQSVSVTSVSLDGVTLTSDDYDIIGNTGKEKNTYTVTVTGKGNYKDTAAASWKIVARAMTVTAEPVSKTYDGNEYGITVNVTEPSTGTTVKYGTEEGEYNLDASPKFKTAGTHTVYFKVSGNINYNDYEGSATVTISKKTVTANVYAEDKTYDGKTDATVSASVASTDLIEGDSIEITGLKGSFDDANAGENKKVTVDSSLKSISGTGLDNYEVTIPAETAASISKAVPKVNAPAQKTLIYTGSAQELVTAGSTTDGEIQYVLGKDDKTAPDEGWSTSVPSETDAGTYYVWYKVVGDENHTDTEPEVLKVEIIEKGETGIKTEVKKDDKSPEIKASNLTKDFAESTLTSEEKADIEDAISNGKDVDVDVYLEIEDISDAISASDKEKIKASATNADNIAFFDISLFKKISISGQSQGAASIHNLTTPLKLTIGVPKSFPAVADGYTRTYVVLRLHDGSVTVLPTTLNADGTLSFETDKFSTYALAYTDVKKEETKEPTADTPTTTVDTPTTKVDTPTANADTSKAEVKNTDNKISTGDKMNIGIIIMLMVDSAMAALYLTLRKKMIK